MECNEAQSTHEEEIEGKNRMFYILDEGREDSEGS